MFKLYLSGNFTSNPYKISDHKLVNDVERHHQIHKNKPILIAGQTASGKSRLAIHIAEKQGGTIINADAIQVYDNWRILTARPSIADETQINHKLYGHINGAVEYSVGNWIKEIKEVISSNSRPIIVGGTGLYFSALTNGLVDIPLSLIHI